MATPDPTYDLLSLPLAGQVLTRERLDALWEAWEDNDFEPLSDTQIAAAAGPAQTFPSTIPRLATTYGG